MTNRDWFCIAIRLLGIWLLIDAVESIVSNVLFVISGLLGPGDPYVTYVVNMSVWLIARTTIGLVLLFFAPAIAARFYPSTQTTETTHSDAEVRPLKVGLQLLAIYALLLAVQSGAGVILGLFSGNVYDLGLGANVNFSATGYLERLLNCGLNLAFAGVFLMWNERVVTLIEKFRYIPERDSYRSPGESS
jgi:hypothetical protein